MLQQAVATDNLGCSALPKNIETCNTQDMCVCVCAIPCVAAHTAQRGALPGNKYTLYMLRAGITIFELCEHIRRFHLSQSKPASLVEPGVLDSCCLVYSPCLPVSRIIAVNASCFSPPAQLRPKPVNSTPLTVLLANSLELFVEHAEILRASQAGNRTYLLFVRNSALDRVLGCERMHAPLDLPFVPEVSLSWECWRSAGSHGRCKVTSNNNSGTVPTEGCHHS